MTKQVIVVNKGLGMSKGKMAAQVAHASEAFLLKQFLNGTGEKHGTYGMITRELKGYILQIPVNLDTYEWITSSYIPTLPGRLFFLSELAGPLTAECN